MSVPVPTGVFGTSIALVDGDFTLVAGDLALISGRDNFVQALHVIVGTPFGSDPININYGLDVEAIFTVANSVRSIKDVIKLNLAKSLGADDRIREITEIVFDDDPDFGVLAPELAGGDPGATARHGRQWHAVVAFTSVAGSEQQVLVSGVGP
jgi:hypothetical protein